MAERQPSSRTCFVCGRDHAAGLRARWWSDRASGEARGELVIPELFNGFPGVVHGGVVAALLDEAMVRSALLEGGFDDLMVTARMEVSYLRPVPTGVPVTAAGRLVKAGGRRATASAELRLPGGTVATRAEALLARAPPEVAAAWAAEREHWRVEEALPPAAAGLGAAAVPSLPGLDELEAAAALIREAVPPTPQIAWPLLSARAGATVWLKHENHTPVGAFKVRGGLVYLDALRRDRPDVRGVVTATRGNHGQSIAFAARRHGLRAVVVVPDGNNPEKNAAMRALGAELVEHGADFQDAAEHAGRLAEAEGLFRLPSFDPLLVRGVGTYALELLRAVPGLERIYVPIGLGSGICGVLAARAALGLGLEVVGVVSSAAPAYARAFASGVPGSVPAATALADGVAVRTPDPLALRWIREGVARIVEVSDAEVASAMAALFRDTHNAAEGAGALGLAGLLRERDRNRGRSVATVLSGANVDASTFAEVLRSGPPAAP
jgi:threonine dehydratase